jgi:hypothetical protein
MKPHPPLAAFISALFLLASTSSGRTAAGRLVTGSDASAGGPHVKAFTTRTQTAAGSYFAYTPSFAGGVRVAAGDVNGDGGPDIVTGSGPGAGHVKVFAGGAWSEVRSFLPYGSGFSGGVFVATGDLDGDGHADIVTGVDEGAAPHVKVFSGATGTEIRSFFAYPVGFTGGVRVATGDINGDGLVDIITGTGPGSGPHVKVFDGRTGAELKSFFAYPAGFTGGVYVAAGDVNGDGVADIITGAGPGGGPHVRVFDGISQAELHSFFAYDVGFQGGVRVAAGDVDGDGLAEIITGAGPGGLPQVRVLDGGTLAQRASFLAYSETFLDGVFVGVAAQLHPRLETAFDRVKEATLLHWPAGCLCELEGNPKLGQRNGWKPLPVEPVRNGLRLEVPLPTDLGTIFFRLNCDDEALPQAPVSSGLVNRKSTF